MNSSRKRPRTAPKPIAVSEPIIPIWQIYGAFIAIILVYVALRLPGIGIPLDRDEGAFGYMGQLVNRGGLPYRDASDHKPPVAFYINAFALHFFPATENGVHIFLLIYNLLTLLCLFQLARTYFESLSAGLWCALSYAVFSASPAIQGFTASTEMWALLPVSGSLLLAVLGIKKNSAALIFLSGAAGAIACWTKQTVFTSVLFVLLFVTMAAMHSRRIRDAALWIGGAIMFSASLVLYFYARGALRELIYWCFTYSFSYAEQASFSQTAGLLQTRFSDILAGDFILILAAISTAIWSIFRDKPRAYFLLGFFILSLLGTLPGFASPHYFAQLAPSIALAAGFGFSILLRQCRTTRSRLASAVCCGAVAVMIPVMVNRQYFLETNPDTISRIYFGDNPFPESKPVADYIARNTQPTDPVFIVGSEPEILFYAKRRSPSSFLMIYPLMTTHPRYKELQHQMLAEVTQNPPKYIVAILHIPTSFMWDQAADPEIMRSLDALIDRDYTLDRARSVSGLNGEWIEAGDGRLQSDAPFLYIFKRKM
jgi:Dolichyl-phosphate-mannose-protein mannosyltransferase